MHPVRNKKKIHKTGEMTALKKKKNTSKLYQWKEWKKQLFNPSSSLFAYLLLLSPFRGFQQLLGNIKCAPKWEDELNLATYAESNLNSSHRDREERSGDFPVLLVCLGNSYWLTCSCFLWKSGKVQSLLPPSSSPSISVWGPIDFWKANSILVGRRKQVACAQPSIPLIPLAVM